MDPKQFEKCAETLVLSAFDECKNLHLKALQILVSKYSSNHQAWAEEKQQLLHQLGEATERIQMLESVDQRRREDGAAERRQHADKVAELTSSLRACEDHCSCLQTQMDSALKAATQHSKQHARAEEELCKLKDQLQTCLEYRKKCKHQLTEIQSLRQRLADKEAGGQHAAQQGQRTEQHLNSTQAMARSQHSAMSKEKHWPVGYLSLKPTAGSPSSLGSDSRRQEAMPEAAPGRNNDIARLLQRVQEAEDRAEYEAQMRLRERENFKAMHQRKLQRTQQEYDELKAKYDAKKRQAAHIWGPSQDGGDQQYQEECGEVDSGTAAELMPQDCQVLHNFANAIGDADTPQLQQVQPTADSRPQPLRGSASNGAGDDQLSRQQSASMHPSKCRQGPRSPVAKPAHGSRAGSEKHGASSERKRSSDKDDGLSVQASQQQRHGRASAGPAAARPTAQASKTCPDGLARQAKASAAAKVQALRSFLDNASCSREATYNVRPERVISPGKRTSPDDSAAHATEEAIPAKRLKRNVQSRAEQLPEHSKLHVKPPVQATVGQDLQIGQPMGRSDQDPHGSKSALKPASISHLLSEENVRNSQDTTCAQVYGCASPSGPSEDPVSINVSQQEKSPAAAPQDVGNCLPSKATAPELADGSAIVLQKDEGPSGKHELTAEQGQERAASAAVESQAQGAAQQPEGAQLAMAASAAALQQSQGTARQAAQPGQAGRLTQVGLETPPGSSPPPSPQVDSALPGQAAMQPCQLQERSSEAGGSQKTRVAVAVKEESVRGSPEWKVRVTKEAEAQHTGNTLFVEACQPDVSEAGQDGNEEPGPLTQLLGPNRPKQIEQSLRSKWKTKQREGSVPDALAFLGVANVQHSSNPRIYQRLPAIVDRHEPEALQQQQGAGQATKHGMELTDAGTGYKYKEVVRKRAEREDLVGMECPDCRRFYAACQTWSVVPPGAAPQCGHALQEARRKGGAAGAPEGLPTREQLRQNASRHRYHYEPPATPPGFWDMGFMDSLDSRTWGDKGEK